MLLNFYIFLYPMSYHFGLIIHAYLMFLFNYLLVVVTFKFLIHLNLICDMMIIIDTFDVFCFKVILNNTVIVHVCKATM